MKVAAIQMVSGTRLDANLQRAKALLSEAAHAGTELALLPEYFCLLGQRDTDKLAIQEAPGQGTIQEFLAETARSLGLWIVGGTMPLSASQDDGAQERVFNSSLAYSPQGECVARYD
jgi:predicted amidohydrolase